MSKRGTLIRPPCSEDGFNEKPPVKREAGHDSTEEIIFHVRKAIQNKTEYVITLIKFPSSGPYLP